MMNMPAREGSQNDQEILIKVKAVIAKIVMTEPEKIADDAVLTDDLGLESIDFLDLNFRLEEIFGIVLPPKNPVQRFTDRLGMERFMADGVVTPLGIRFLELIFPDAGPERLQNIPTAGIMSLISVRTYVNLVKRCLEISAWQPESCPECHGSDLARVAKEQLEYNDNREVLTGPVYQCETCHILLYPPAFDEKIMAQLDGLQK